MLHFSKTSMTHFDGEGNALGARRGTYSGHINVTKGLEAADLRVISQPASNLTAAQYWSGSRAVRQCFAVAVMQVGSAKAKYAFHFPGGKSGVLFRELTLQVKATFKQSKQSRQT